jgi:hypothetical protein
MPHPADERSAVEKVEGLATPSTNVREGLGGSAGLPKPLPEMFG